MLSQTFKTLLGAQIDGSQILIFLPIDWFFNLEAQMDHSSLMRQVIKS
jgi:hypothetical protein